ncbi:outer membrane lipoprotein carrier protein [Candidatus Symbiobacter mobilis CR]|uniref:Outer-membrane lipoprotein carrier protein n=2 Tax=Candidatus Symbiobacter TaxID=1436289 RepID=U5N7F6_9BURK|nr:outer membrane lipoprotein carrier protein [Candidatus Symbiobacter mobilis CR]
MQQLWPLFLWCLAESAQASALQCLDTFLRTVRTGRATFVQEVHTPSKVQTAHGTFAFARPGRFRFDYAPPFAQTIVADGKQLWFHDHDLRQVTVRGQTAALADTPAALLASAADSNALRSQYALRDAPERDGLQWVQATPTESMIASVQLGMVCPAGPAPTVTPAVLELLDHFGQRTVIRFDQFEANPSLDAALFRYRPPAGIDIVAQ